MSEPRKVVRIRDIEDATCDTGRVRGLSDEIIAMMRRIEPGLLVPLSTSAVVAAPRVNLYFQAAAAKSLLRVLKDGGRRMEIHSAYRTVAQQYLLVHWYETKRCDANFARPPGTSNHEDGAAVDCANWRFWKSHFLRHGWSWAGPKEPWHFSYRGAGFVDHVGEVGVKGYQALWNENANPEQQIPVDGDYGPRTEHALRLGPILGWGSGEVDDGE